MTDLVDAVDLPIDEEQPVVAPDARAPPCPLIVATPVPPNRLRTLSGMSRSDYLNLGGALLSSISITLLLFGILAPLSGTDRLRRSSPG